MKLFHTRPSRRSINQRVLAVEGGELMCPRRGPVDIEECWMCPAYRGLSGGPIEGVVCGTEPLVMPFARSMTG